jgi:hypothetical protein
VGGEATGGGRNGNPKGAGEKWHREGHGKKPANEKK